MEKEKTGLSTSAQDAIADAAKANVDAAMKVASSAVTAFVDTLAGRTKTGKDKAWEKVRLANCRPQDNQKNDEEEAHS